METLVGRGDPLKNIALTTNLQIPPPPPFIDKASSTIKTWHLTDTNKTAIQSHKSTREIKSSTPMEIQ